MGLLPTPTRSDANSSGAAGYSTASGRHSGTTLTDAVVRGMLPTPTRSDGKQRGTPASTARRIAIGKQVSLDGLAGAGMLPTPTATQWKGWSPGHNRAQTNDRLDYTVEREAHGTGGGRLNPAFVEWMMGFPEGWTALDDQDWPRSATRSSRKSPKPSGEQS
jgi:hypothetical protein